MALIIPPGYAQVLIPHTHDALARSAVVTFAVSAAAYAGDWDVLANDLQFVWHDAWETVLDNQVQVGPVTVRVGQDGGDPLSVEGNTTDYGTETAQALPPNCALLIRKSTALGGRRGRGRMYVPWVVQEPAVNDVGTIDSTSLAGRQSAATAFLGALNLGTGMAHPAPMYLLHDSSGIGAEPGPTAVTGLSCDALIATQRRRLGR